MLDNLCLKMLLKCLKHFIIGKTELQKMCHGGRGYLDLWVHFSDVFKDELSNVTQVSQSGIWAFGEQFLLFSLV